MLSWTLQFVLALTMAVLGIGGLTAGMVDSLHVPFFICFGLLVASVIWRLAASR